MCGIAGIASFGKKQKHRFIDVSNLLEAIKHRGPDGKDIFSSPEIDLGAVRLAMVDIASKDVLLHDLSNDLHLAYNGEIYNFRELRNDPQLAGYKLSTQGDGEVILALYKVKGLSGLADLDGMFSFALWDGNSRTLHLARDRYGIKPLYYTNADGQFTFCSELKGIHGLFKGSLRICKRALRAYFDHRFVHAPLSIFEGIYKVRPGHVLSISKDSFVESKFAVGHVELGSSQPLDEVFAETIISTAQAEVGMGVFLSGGIDSSLILSTLSLYGQSSMSFTVGYDTKSNSDETSYAAEMAQWAKQENLSVNIRSSEVYDRLKEAVMSLDEPLYSTVSVSTLALAKLARPHVKGVLSGDGSDELLASYTYFRTIKSQMADGRDWRASYRQQIGWLSDDEGNFLLEGTEDTGFFDDFEAHADLDPFEKMRHYELMYRLPDYHLTRLDRLTMANGLEGRVPFLRHGIASRLLSYPVRDLLAMALPKSVLLDLEKPPIPDFSFLRKKQPFTSPHVSWLQTTLKPHTTRLFTNHAYCKGLGIRINSLKLLLEKFHAGDNSHASAVWGMLMLFMWYEGYMTDMAEERQSS